MNCNSRIRSLNAEQQMMKDRQRLVNGHGGNRNEGLLQLDVSAYFTAMAESNTSCKHQVGMLPFNGVQPRMATS